MLQSKDRVGCLKTTISIYMMPMRETHLDDTHILKVKGQKKIFQANGNQKEAGVAILISITTDFKTDCQ